MEKVLQALEKVTEERGIYKEEHDKITKVLNFKEGSLNLPVELVIESLKKSLERYKRLAEANLTKRDEFMDNMCKHRCILKSKLQELKENSIPTKKIEDKIKLIEMEEHYDYKINYTSKQVKKLLQELLEDK